MSVEPNWLTVDDVVAIHDDQIRQFGGSFGIRDIGLIESALGNPRNDWAYGHQEDTLMLAVVTGISIGRNHGFVDGNKRTAFGAIGEFLAINGYRLIMEDVVVPVLRAPLLGTWIEKAVQGLLSAEELADRLDQHVIVTPRSRSFFSALKIGERASGPRYVMRRDKGAAGSGLTIRRK